MIIYRTTLHNIKSGRIPSRNLTLYLCFLFLLPLFFIPPCVIGGDGNSIEDFTVQGFGTFGFVTSDDDLIGFRRNSAMKKGVRKGDIAFETDSRIGVQLNYRPATDFSGVVQFLLKDQDEQSFDTLLQLALLEYRPRHDLSIRLGRMKSDVYMLSDYRDIGFAYLWARPVTEFYGMMPFQFVDGGDVTYSKRLGEGKLSLNGFAGWTQFTLDTNWIQVERSPVYGFNIIYEQDFWKVRGVVLKLDYDNVTLRDDYKSIMDGVGLFSDFVPGASDIKSDMEIDGTSSLYSSLGFAYDDSDWQIQAEVSHIKSDHAFINESVQGYVSVGHRFGEFTPYVTYGVVKPVSSTYKPSHVPGNDPALNDINRLLQLASAVNNLVRPEQQTISLGIRWDMTAQTALKFQWNHSHMEESGSSLWHWTEDWAPPESLDVNVFSLTLDFIF